MNLNKKMELTVLDMATRFDNDSSSALVCALENHNLLRKIEMQGKTVLEVGCGCLPACFGIPDEKMPVHYVALDTIPQIVEEAQRFDPRPEYRVGSIMETELEKCYYDVVILRGVLHHLANPTKVLLHLSTFIKSGGKLLLYEPNLSCISGNIIKLVMWHIFRITMEDSPYGQLPRKTILSAVKNGGFQLVREWYSSLLAFPLSGDYGRRRVLPNSRWLFSIIVKADRFFSWLLHLLPILARWSHLRVIFLIQKSE